MRLPGTGDFNCRMLVTLARRFWFLALLLVVIPFGVFAPAGGRAIAGSGFALPVLVACTLFVSGFLLDSRKILRRILHVRAILFTLFTTYAVAPAIAVVLCRLLGPEDGDSSATSVRFLEAQLIAATQASTLASAMAFTMLARGDEELALVLMVASNALTVFLTPLALALTLGASVTLPLGSMVARLSLVVLLPVALGQLARRAFWNRAAPAASFLRQVPAAIMLVFVYTGTSSAAAELRTESTLALRFLLVCATLHLSLIVWILALSAVLGLERPVRTAVLFSASQKTLPNGIYLWRGFFPENPYGALALVIYHAFQLITAPLLLPLLGSSRQESIEESSRSWHNDGDAQP